MTQNIDNLTTSINNLTAVLNIDATKEITLINSIQDVMAAIKKRAESKDHQLRLLKDMLEILTAKEEQAVQENTTPQPENTYTQTVQQYSQPPVYQEPIASVPQQQPQPSPLPTAQVTYTLDQLSVAATALMDAGKRQDLMNLLGKYQIPAMTSLPKEQYASFAAELRALGAKL